ncbi:MAG: hypothetical protein LBU50_00440 [Cellulomonas sp.]|nr:hypothetical protein [Cellulomonas sp.]
MVALALVGCSGTNYDDLPSCLVGTWNGNPSEMEPWLAHMLSEDGDVSLTVSGTQTQTFQADGSYDLYTDIAIDLASNGPGDDAFEQGTAEGTWTLEGDRLTLTYASTDIMVWSAHDHFYSTMQDGTYLVTCSATTLTSTEDPTTLPADTPDSLRNIVYTSQRK